MIGEYFAMTAYDAMFSRWCQIDVAALTTLNRRFTSLNARVHPLFLKHAFVPIELLSFYP